MGIIEAIIFVQIVSNMVFHVTSTMLHILQMKSLLGGLARKDRDENIKKNLMSGDTTQEYSQVAT